MRHHKLFIEVLEDRRVLSADFNGNGTIDAPDLANGRPVSGPSARQRNPRAMPMSIGTLTGPTSWHGSAR
jgi:hypothetical protein